MISHGQGGPKNMIPAMVTDMGLKTSSSALWVLSSGSSSGDSTVVVVVVVEVVIQVNQLKTFCWVQGCFIRIWKIRTCSWTFEPSVTDFQAVLVLEKMPNSNGRSGGFETGVQTSLYLCHFFFKCTQCLNYDFKFSTWLVYPKQGE